MKDKTRNSVLVSGLIPLNVMPLSFSLLQVITHYRLITSAHVRRISFLRSRKTSQTANSKERLLTKLRIFKETDHTLVRGSKIHKEEMEDQPSRDERLL